MTFRSTIPRWLRGRCPPVVLAIALAHPACGGAPDRAAPDGAMPDGGGEAIPAPPAPAQLVATGTLRNIHLAWSASDGAAGYHVYRSAGGEPERITRDPVTATSYDDPIESPAGDGVLYRYQVTAVDQAESEPSSSAATVHGTRLRVQFQTQPDASPYVAEGTFVADSGLTVTQGTKLYVLDGAVIDLGADNRFTIDGLIRSVPSGGPPARITAHMSSGSALRDGLGLLMLFQGVPYVPGDDSGSRLEHVQIEHLQQFDSGNLLRGAFVVLGAPIKLRNVKLSGADSRGSGRLSVQDTWIILEESFLDELKLSIAADMRGTPFRIAHNVVRHAPLVMDTLGSPPAVSPGQIDANDFSGVAGLERNGLRVPLGNNYWAGGSGTPPLPSSVDVADFADPSPALSTPPTAGTDW